MAAYTAVVRQGVADNAVAAAQNETALALAMCGVTAARIAHTTAAATDLANTVYLEHASALEEFSTRCGLSPTTTGDMTQNRAQMQESIRAAAMENVARVRSVKEPIPADGMVRPREYHAPSHRLLDYVRLVVWETERAVHSAAERAPTASSAAFWLRRVLERSNEAHTSNLFAAGILFRLQYEEAALHYLCEDAPNRKVEKRHRLRQQARAGDAAAVTDALGASTDVLEYGLQLVRETFDFLQQMDDGAVDRSALVKAEEAVAHARNATDKALVWAADCRALAGAFVGANGVPVTGQGGYIV